MGVASRFRVSRDGGVTNGRAIAGIARADFLERVRRYGFLVTLLIAGNRTIMGTYTNGRLANIIGWTTLAIMTAAAIALIATSVTGT